MVSERIERSTHLASPLEQSQALFIRRWGTMGSSWGISRTMAEIHALLYVSDRPLCTDDVMRQLQVSRGNASMNLRQLLNWGLIRRVHQLGDRKDYFAAETDVWQMFQTIIRERRRRELEPILDTIDRCREMVAEGLRTPRGADRRAMEVYHRRLDEIRDFLEMMNALLNGVLKAGSGGVKRSLPALTKMLG